MFYRQTEEAMKASQALYAEEHGSTIYFVQRRDGAIKIGRTMDLRSRLGQLKGQHGTLALLGTTPGYKLEYECHYAFGWLNLKRPPRGEWFRDDPALHNFIAMLPLPVMVAREHLSRISDEHPFPYLNDGD